MDKLSSPNSIQMISCNKNLNRAFDDIEQRRTQVNELAEACCGAIGEGDRGLCLGRSGLGSSGLLMHSAVSYNKLTTSSLSLGHCCEQNYIL